MPETTVGQHSPAPWSAYLGQVIGADRTVVATVNRPSGGNKRTENANEALVIAAPELLTIARAYVDLAAEVGDYDGAMPSLPDGLAHAKALLAKIGGAL